jgi:hypothetical protein
MRKTTFWLTLGASATVLASGADGVHARPMEGRFGVGLERTLGGATGLALRFFPSDAFALVATAGVDIVLADKDGDTEVSAGVAASVGGMFHFSRSEHAHIAVGARLTLGYRSLDAFQLIDPTATSTDIDIAIELPIALEVWISSHFSLTVATGILIDFVPASGAQLRGDGAGSQAPNGGLGIGFGAGSITATIGALYYF